MIDFLDWVARAGGAIALLVAMLAFMFKAKWRQILQRSLATDLERLKSELAKSQAEHAATLTPQLEQIKHDFQQKLEAYKITLIAEAEAVKARGDLRKTIALRYAEIEFERLISLEHILAPLAADLLAICSFPPERKSLERTGAMVDRLTQFAAETDKAEMFMQPSDRTEIVELRIKLIKLLRENAGPGTPELSESDPDRNLLLTHFASTHRKLMDRIRSMGAL